MATQNNNNDIIFPVIGLIFFVVLIIGFVAIENSFSMMYNPAITEWDNKTYTGLLFDTLDGSRIQIAYVSFGNMFPGLMWLFVLLIILGILYYFYKVSKTKRGKNPIFDKNKRLKFKKFKDI